MIAYKMIFLNATKGFSRTLTSRSNFNNVFATHFSRSYSSENTSVKKTCLYDYHVKHGGKMVDFAGFLMPVQYSDLSITDSHIHTRQSASLFDVSHMLQMAITGKHSVEFIESMTVADVANLTEDTGTLTLYTNENGGIIDDLIVTKTSLNYIYVVSNAGRIDYDLAHVQRQRQLFYSKGKDVSITVLNRALLALQGPASAECLQPIVKADLSRLYFMSTVISSVCGVDDCRITRCGYTGEDGFEISIPLEKAEHVAESLMQNPKVKLAGLGARDTLRLEAGLCLYGNDIDETTSPIESSLTWTIAKRRREQANFPGASIILKQLKERPVRRRVGMSAISGGPPARSRSTVLCAQTKQKIGEVTSGTISPSLKQNIAMSYVPISHSKIGTKVICDTRGKQVEYEVVKMPFITSKYYIKK